MRLALLLSLGLVVAACGSSRATRPKGPAPSAGAQGPPPAWIETKAGTRWLAYSSYCWSLKQGNAQAHGCADMAAPKCSQKSVPKLEVDSGEQVRAHLGYDAQAVSVEHEATKLDGRTVAWRIHRSGPFLLFTKGRPGDASYTGCAVLP
jgi:hypothetical protein